MRQTLEKHYGDKPVGMGGTFILQKGKVKTHVMVRGCEGVNTYKYKSDYNLISFLFYQ